MSVEKLRGDARDIFEAGLRAADPIVAVTEHLKRDGDKLHIQDRVYELNEFENIYVIGMGKAAASMAHAIEVIL
ncbi:MAG: DUF4147 domain-containing protein, partial [Nitrosopumilaceae archaeon]|nr:DUF4147 domain-containing protein [Nitrosopumilaceae archaeon]